MGPRGKEIKRAKRNPFKANAMRQFTEGQNRLGLRELCQKFADEQWVADHLTSKQAAESVLREFKRGVRAELELLEITCDQVDAPQK
jgi:hypothetical protein